MLNAGITLSLILFLGGSWTFDELLAKPADSEIDAVRGLWKARSIQPSAVEIAGRYPVRMEYATFDVTVFSYRLGRSRQFGAAFVPDTKSTDPLPVVIGARGVRWDYPVRDLTNGPYAAKVLGPLQREFVFLAPVLRGHAFRFDNDTYSATGDRRDSWDGATSDMIAFLDVALENLPRANGEKIISFGASRGAAVALLHAARDKRVGAAVGYATPADFFRLMGRPGENWSESLQAAYADPELPRNSRESQFIEWFLEDRESMSLQDIRRRLVASSPLYFAGDLPPTQLHHGADDASVPVRNAQAIKDRFLALDMHEPYYSVLVHEGFGHRLDESGAFEATRQWVRQFVDNGFDEAELAGETEVQRRLDISISDDDPAADQLRRIFAEAHDVVTAFWSGSFPESVNVIVAADRSLFDAEIPPEWGLKSQCWMVGLGVADFLLYLSPSAWPNEACEHDPTDAQHVLDIAAHELAHVYHGQTNRTRDFTGAEEVGWFVEGLAVVVAGQLNRNRYSDPAVAIQEGAAPEKLQDAWSGQYRYAISGSIVDYIDKNYGRDTLYDLMAATTQVEILDALGISEQQLLADWRSWVSAN